MEVGKTACHINVAHIGTEENVGESGKLQYLILSIVLTIYLQITLVICRDLYNEPWQRPHKDLPR